MMDFKRLNKNSKIVMLDMRNKTIEDFNNTIKEIEEPTEDGSHRLILQMQIENECLFLEYICVENDGNCGHDYNSKIKDGDIEFENALDTVINKDPFGAKYSGKRIREIFENGDAAWLDFALKNMHNPFILDKLKYIVSRGGYGKILC